MFNSKTTQEVVALPVGNPYAIAMSVEPKIISPLIKYGVNPVTGVPLTTDLLAEMVEAAGMFGENDPKTDPLVVGEQRIILCNIFKNRAEIVFSNMVQSLNRVHDEEIRLNFKGTYKTLTKMGRFRGYDDDFTSSIPALELFSLYLFGDSNEMPGSGVIMDRGNASVQVYRYRNPKLYDLEYYMAMPVDVVLGNLLSAVSYDYTRVIRGLSNSMNSANEDSAVVAEYDSFKWYLGSAYANLLCAAEAAVMMLYSEANTLIKAGYPGQFGMDYDTAKTISTVAENDTYYDAIRIASLTELTGK